MSRGARWHDEGPVLSNKELEARAFSIRVLLEPVDDFLAERPLSVSGLIAAHERLEKALINVRALGVEVRKASR